MDRGSTWNPVLGAKYALGVVLLCVLWAAPAAAQCAMCRRALESPEGRQMVAAFRSGILILLAAPFSLFGVITALVVRMRRRQGPS